jgi:hypothetical protein
MKILGPILVATLLALPAPALGEPESGATADEAEAPGGGATGAADPATQPEADSEADAAAAEEVAVDEDGEALDEDDLVEVHGLVYEFFIEDDGMETQLGIEAVGGDYLVRGGGAAGALAQQLGKTVTARGWTISDESGDTWILVEGFRIEE